MTDEDSALSDELARADVDQPNIARIYDYHLGGAANFAVDRHAGDELERVWPAARAYAHANRAFLGRVVRTLTTEWGFDQFLDLGSGVPTVGNVHEIAHRNAPQARIAYVDREAIAVHHARRLLGPDEDRVTVTQADVVDVETVLSSPGVTGLLDFSRPVAVLALGILELLPDRDPTPLLARYRAACVSGSALALSYTAQLDQSDAEVAGVRSILAPTSTPQLHLRTRDEVAALLPGYTLLEPGVVPTPAWRPDQPVTDEEANRANAYGAVGLLD